MDEDDRMTNVPLTEAHPSAVTVSVTRRMSTNNETQVLTWVNAGMAMAERFDGFLGTGWVRSSRDPQEWHMLYRFADAASLEAWEESPERQWWLSFGSGMVEHQRGERRVGIEGWFDEPSERHEFAPDGRRATPPRWKQATMIWVVFFPMSVLATFLLKPLTGTWPVVPRVFLQTILLTPVMTYFFLPLAGRVLDKWLHKP